MLEAIIVNHAPLHIFYKDKHAVKLVLETFLQISIQINVNYAIQSVKSNYFNFYRKSKFNYKLFTNFFL